MLVFWVAVAILSLVAAAMVVGGAVRASRAPVEADPTLGLYQRQLGEIDDLVERGLLDPSERRTAHAEAGRRLLAAADDGAASTATATGRVDRTAAICLLAALPAAALAIYMATGAPGLPDQPFGKRVQEWQATNPANLDPQRLAAVLKTILRSRPNDVDGLRFLAQAQLASDEPFEAGSNLRKAIALAPQRADLWQMLGSAIMAENDGAIVPDAEAAFREALKRDPSAPGPRYFIGRARIEAGAPAEGLALWRALLAELPADMPARPGLAADIATVERTGRLPVSNATPPAESAEMQAAVRSMVEGLAARLAQNPDDAEGWVRLVRAYAVLGETAKRDAALATARARYKDQPQIMAALAQALEAPQ